MSKKFHNSRGSSTHDRNPVPRWRSVFVALVLALVIASASLPAQAAPQSQQGFGYELYAHNFNDGTMICVGDIVKIHVKVTRGFQNLQNVQPVPGVNVRASSSNDSIGWYAPRQANTGYMADHPGTIIFNFHAEKAGTATLTFEGTINHTWLGIPIGTYTRTDQVVLTVDECQYRIFGASEFSPGPGAVVWGSFKDAVMTLGSNGLYTGTATVKWFGYLPPTLCVGIHLLDFATTKAELTGVRDAQGLFHVIIAYDPGESTWRATCYAAFVDKQKLDPPELKFTVEGSGEVVELPHGMSFSLGQTTVTVIREKTSGQ